MSDYTKGNAGVIIITLMLALIVRAALDATFEPVFQAGQGWATLSAQSWVQVVIFFLMMLRFYLGALRFCDLACADDFFVEATNFVFALLVFGAFYVIATAVVKPGYFYTLVVALHTIDALWFATLLGYSVLNRLPTIRLEDGTVVRVSAVRKVMGVFLAISVSTLAFALISYKVIFGAEFSDPTAVEAHWCFLVWLSIVSVIDFWALHDYYFNHQRWRSNNSAELSVPRRSASGDSDPATTEA